MAKRKQLELSPGPLFDSLPLQVYGRPTRAAPALPSAAPAPKAAPAKKGAPKKSTRARPARPAKVEAPPAAPAPLDRKAKAAQRKAIAAERAASKQHERATIAAGKAQRLAEYTAEEGRLLELVKQLRGWRKKASAVRTLEALRTLPHISAAAKHHAGSIFTFKG